MTQTAAAPDLAEKSRKLSRPSPAKIPPLLLLILTFLLLSLILTPHHARAQDYGDFDLKAPESDARPEVERRVEEQLAEQISVAQAANRIAKAIRAAYPGMNSLLIYNDGDIRLLLVYGAATKRIDAYTTRYANLAAAGAAALAADPAWTGPSAPCDEAAFARERFEVRAAPANPTGAASNSNATFGYTLALFRADLSAGGGVAYAGEPVVVTEVFRALREQYHGSIALYYPTEIPPGFDPTRDSQLLDKLEALFNAKANAEAAAAQIAQRLADKRELISRLEKCRAAADSSQAALQKLVSDQQKKTDDLDRAILLRPKGRPTAAQRARQLKERETLADLRARLEPRAASLWPVMQRLGDDVRRLEKQLAALRDVPGPLAALNAQAELLVKDLTRADDKTGLNPLAAFMRAEMIQKFMRENNACWLKIRVVAAGGSTKVRSNLFADLFKGGGRVWYSGASIVEYHLYDRLGRSLLSDTTNSYEEYRKAEDVKKLADDRERVDQR